VLFIGLCSCAQKPASVAQTRTRLDSIVLERTPCYGTCPAYRLTLASNGRVTFESRNRFEDRSQFSDSISPAALDAIAAQAERIGFASLPDTIDRHRAMCQDYATDHPTIIVGLFGARSKQVVYYTGCFVRCCEHERADALRNLAQLASDIDAATGARRWIKPGRARP
jgi:hypothetical protein